MLGYCLHALAVNFFPCPRLRLLIDIRNNGLSFIFEMFVCFLTYVKQDEENLSTSSSKLANIFKKGSFHTINDFSGESDLIVFINKGDA